MARRSVKALEAEIARLEQGRVTLRAIIESEPECVKLVSPEGELLEMNPAGLAMLEAGSLAEARERPLIDFVAPEHREAFLDLHARALAGEKCTLCFDVIGRKGRRRTLESTAVALRDPAGEVTAVLAITHDVTERRQLEERLRQAQQLEAIGRLAGGVAHDFNNLLTVILGYAEMLELRLGRDPAARCEVGEIRRAGERARDMTRQLLQFARLQPRAPRPLDLNRVIRGSEGLLRRLLREDISISLDLRPDLWTVRADPHQVEQILLNLAANARDAMAAGGNLAVATRNRTVAGDAGLAAGLAPGEYAVLEVRDSGAGIEPNLIGHIFEPFFTTKPFGQGTGLGLATVYGIVAQSGGQIEVDSLPGQGTSFRIHLPRTTEAPAPEPAPAVPESRAGSERLLVVEDDPTVRSYTVSVLRAAGYRVDEAGDGRQALQLAATSVPPPDLVVTDVVMPGMGGPELARALNARYPGLPILFVSGHGPDAHAFRSGDPAAPAVALLSKPFAGRELLDRVRELLDDRRPAEGR